MDNIQILIPVTAVALILAIGIIVALSEVLNNPPTPALATGTVGTVYYSSHTTAPTPVAPRIDVNSSYLRAAIGTFTHGAHRIYVIRDYLDTDHYAALIISVDPGGAKRTLAEAKCRGNQGSIIITWMSTTSRHAFVPDGSKTQTDLHERIKDIIQRAVFHHHALFRTRGAALRYAAPLQSLAIGWR